MWFTNLFTGSGVASTILMLAISIFAGLLLGKFKVKGVTLGITWVLFVGIALSACGVSLNGEMLHIIKEFGLILFVTAVGLQVGPGFFKSFKKGGLALNTMALVNVALGVLITVIIAKVADQSLTDMAGVYTGAITNTPGLSAAQQTVRELGMEGAADQLASGYAVAYPLAVVGMIVTCLLLRPLCRIDLAKEPTTEQMIDAAKEKGATPTSQRHKINLVPIFVIIAVGIILGSIPIPVGMSAPVRVHRQPRCVDAARSRHSPVPCRSRTERWRKLCQHHSGWGIPVGSLWRDYHHGTAAVGWTVWSFGAESQLLYFDGLYRRQPYRPSDLGLCQQYGTRGLQVAEYRLCHRLSFDYVPPNLHCTTAGADGVRNNVSKKERA